MGYVEAQIRECTHLDTRHIQTDPLLDNTT